MGLDNTAKAEDHVKIESIYSVSQKNGACRNAPLWSINIFLFSTEFYRIFKIIKLASKYHLFHQFCFLSFSRYVYLSVDT